MYTCTFMQVAACVQKKPESRSLDGEATPCTLANTVVTCWILCTLNLCGLYFLASGIFSFSFYLGCNFFERLYHHLFLFQQLQQQWNTWSTAMAQLSIKDIKNMLKSVPVCSYSGRTGRWPFTYNYVNLQLYNAVLYIMYNREFCWFVFTLCHLYSSKQGWWKPE